MTLIANFTLQDMENYILQQTQNAAKSVLDTFKFAGEGFIREARLKTTYNDITGNLRSSIGYIIIRDVEQVDLNFAPSTNGSDKATGVATGISIAEELAEKYPKGLVLICVAGMDYAAAVEGKARDVITGSSQNLEIRLKQLLSQL